MRPFGSRRSRLTDGTNPEAHRAWETLVAVRAERGSRPAGAGWLNLRARRRKRGIVRGLARTLVLIVVGLGLYGILEAGRMGFRRLRTDTDLFRVRTIAVSGTERLTDVLVIEAAGIRAGDDILDLDMDELARRIEDLPRVKSAQARRTLKREVYLDVVERRPQALVLLDGMHEVDEEGVVLPPDSLGGVADLTIIFGLTAGAPECGQRLEADGLMPALHLIRNLARPEVGLDAVVSEIRAARPDSLVMVMLQDGVPVRVGNGDIPPRRLTAFRAVIEDLARRRVDSEYLDLRFAGQVIVKPRPPIPEDHPGNEASGPGRSRVVEGGRRQNGLNT